MKKLSLWLIVAAGLLWGTSCIFVKFLAPYGISSLQMTFVRGVVALIAMSTFVLMKNKGKLGVNLRDLWLFALIGLTLFVTAASYYSAMQLIGVSTAVVLMYTSPVFVAVASVIIWRERITASRLGALVMLLVGCALTSGVASGFGTDALGLALGLLSGVSYAAYNLLTKVSISRGNDPAGASMLAFAFMIVIAMPFADLGTLPSVVGEAPMPIIPLLVGCGLFTFVLPYFLYTLSMKALSASTASALSVVEPMAATLYSIVFFLYRPDAFEIVGLVLSFAAVVLIGLLEADNKNDIERENVSYEKETDMSCN